MKSCFVFLILFLGSFSFSEAAMEPYTIRPQVESLRSADIQDHYLPYLRAFYLSNVILYNAYPKDTLIVYLARDGEYLYDMARLLFPDKQKERLELWSISTVLSLHSDIGSFVSERLAKKKKFKNIVFVDTGFMGSVPEQIVAKMGSALTPHVDVFLLESDSLRYSSQESVLRFVSGEKMEKLRHYTDTAILLEREGDTLVEYSKASSDKSKAEALSIMQQINRYVESMELKKHFKYFAKTGEWGVDFGDVSMILEDIESVKNRCVFCMDEEMIKQKQERLRELALHLESANKFGNKFEDLADLLPRFGKKLDPELLANIYKRFLNQQNEGSSIEHFEDISLSFLPYLVKSSKISVLKKAIKIAMLLQAEEAIEKFVSRIIDLPVDEFKSFEPILVEVVREHENIFEHTKSLIKLLNITVFTKYSRESLPALFKVYDKLLQESERWKSLDETYSLRGAKCDTAL